MASIYFISAADDLNFEDTPVHVLSTLVKSFFRELPDPLITYDLYENFLNVAGLFGKMENEELLVN